MSEQRLFPMLCYADAAGAIDFLCEAFGFEERVRYEMPDGKIGHAELDCEGAVVMLADEFPAMGFTSPSQQPGFSSQLLVYVDDVEAHCERARKKGAVVVGAPAEDHGTRLYRTMDCEGHRWLFAERGAASAQTREVEEA